jgi:hypothetical protein
VLLYPDLCLTYYYIIIFIFIIVVIIIEPFPGFSPSINIDRADSFVLNKIGSVLYRNKCAFFFNFFQGVLTQVTQSTKQTLNRLGVFTVSSFHAYICARSPSLLNNLLAGRGATKRRTAPAPLSRSNSAAGGGGNNPGNRRPMSNGVATTVAVSPGDRGDTDKMVKVTLPDNQVSGQESCHGRDECLVCLTTLHESL